LKTAKTNPEITYQDSGLPLTVVFYSTRWDEPPRTRHQITSQLARWSNVLFIEYFPTVERQGLEFEMVCSRIAVWRPGRLTDLSAKTLNRLPGARRVLAWKVNRIVVSVVSTIAASCKILVNFSHAASSLMGLRIFSGKVYVCVDEFPSMWRQRSRPPLWRYLPQKFFGLWHERCVARAADLCLAVHQPLVDRLLRFNKNTHLLMQAVELDSYLGLPQRQEHNPDRKIRVAFMGYVTYNQLEDWLAAVAEQEDMELWLIGPIDHKFDPNGRLIGPRVVRTGVKTGRYLAETLSQIDVLIMAYNPEIPEVAVQTASNKFFQYLASGRPVVISDMKYYVNLPEGCLYRAKTKEQFILQIRKAVREDGTSFQKTRWAVACGNTWDRRGEQIHGHLRDLYGDTIPPLMERPKGVHRSHD